MATTRISALSSIFGRQLRTLRAPTQQRRWAQVHDVRFLATTEAPRNVAESYKEKLDRKVREEGVQDIGALKKKFADKIQEVRRKEKISVPGLDALLADEPAPQPQTATTNSSKPPPASQVPPSKASSGKPAIKPLSEILELSKARELPVKELSAIWRLRHASSPLSLCAVIPAHTYQFLEQTARQYPSFVLPVPRAEQGAEIHFLQWVFDKESQTATVLFTQLAEYKARGEWAQPHTSVTHYYDGELAGKQEVVLMAGNVVEGRGATIQDAQWLVALLQRFYGAEGLAGLGEKRKLLEQFGRGDATFSIEKLLEESEKLG